MDPILARAYAAYENSAYDAQIEPQTNILEHAVKYSVAVVGDLAQTLVNGAINVYNWVTPEVMEADNISEYAFMTNSIEEYAKQHASAVKLGSFALGAVLPGIGIAKAVAAARTGASAFGLAMRGAGLIKFSEQSAAAAHRASTLAVQGGRESAAFREAMRTMRYSAYGQAAVENVIYEAGILGLLNAHPYISEHWNPYLSGLGIGVGTAAMGLAAAMRGAKEVATESVRITTTDVKKLLPELESQATMIGVTYGQGSALEAVKGQIGAVQHAMQTTAIAPDSYAAQFANHTVEAYQDHAQRIILDMADPAVRATAGVRSTSATQPAVLFHDLIPNETPSAMRLAAHYLMGQPRQALGITKILPNKPGTVVGGTVAPWPFNAATGHTEIAAVDDSVWGALEGITGPAIRHRDPTTGKLTHLPTNYRAAAISRISPVWQDPTTGVWNIDIRRIKSRSIAAWHVGNVLTRWQGAAPAVRIIDQPGREILQEGYKIYGGRMATQTQISLGRYQVAEEALAAGISPAVRQFQTVSWWNGRVIAQPSIEAHFTTRFNQLPNAATLHNNATTQQFLQITTSTANKPAAQLGLYAASQLLPTELIDKEFVVALSAINRVVSSPGVRPMSEAHILPTDIPKLQAAFLNGPDAIPAGYADLDAVASAMIAAKESHIRQLVANHPTISNFEISIRTNTPLDTIAMVRDAIVDPAKTKMLDVIPVDDWMVYRTTKHYQEALAPTNAVFFQAKHLTEPAPVIAAKLDAQYVAATEQHLVSQIVNKALADPLVDTSLMRSIWEDVVGLSQELNVPAALDQIVQDAAMRSRFGSMDMQLRNYASLDEYATAVGSRLETIINKRGIEAMKEHLRPYLERVRNNKTDIVLYEQTRNALDALGTRTGAAAADLQFEAATRRIQTRAARGTQGQPRYQAAEYLKHTDGSEIVLSPAVYDMMNAVQKNARELWHFRNTIAGLRNEAVEVAQRGVWLPYASPVGQLQAFAFDARTGQITRIMARDQGDFNKLVAAYEADHAAEIAAKQIIVHRRSSTDLGPWLRIHNLAELESIRTTLPTYKKAGIGGQRVTGSVDALSDLVAGLEREYNTVSKQFVRHTQTDIFAKLDRIEAFHNRDTATATSAWATYQKTNSPAIAVKAAMTNNSLINSAPHLQMIDSMFSYRVDQAAKVLREGWANFQEAFKLGRFSDKAYADLTNALAASNIPVPWANKLTYAVESAPELRPIAKHVVAATNATVATFALRLADTSHAIVTTLSAPILLAMEGLGSSPRHGFWDVQKIIMETGRDWMRQATDPSNAWRPILERAQQMGVTVRRTSEATEALATSIGTQSWWQKFQATKGFKAATYASDMSEVMTREMAYMVGWRLNERLSNSPALREAAATLFTNRAMGNYAARQRPIFFQGASGQAIGLFQTFMWTLGQNMIRYTENNSMRAIGAFLGGYTGMFGMESLPMYSVADTVIGKWATNPDDTDITQTVYNAFGARPGESNSRTLAEFMLFGLPSTLTQTAFWTRADTEPRLPVNEGGLPLPPAVNILVNTAEVLGESVRKAAQLSSQPNVNPLKATHIAMLEGIALQNMWRPAARLAELSLGYSIDRKGEKIASGEDIYGPWPWFSRLAAARPLQEQVIRNQNFRSTQYDMADSARSQAIGRSLRTLIRMGGNPADLMGEYIKNGGQPSGWNQIVSEALLTESAPGAQTLIRHTQHQPGIAAIMEGYAF